MTRMRAKNASLKLIWNFRLGYSPANSFKSLRRQPLADFDADFILSEFSCWDWLQSKSWALKSRSILISRLRFPSLTDSRIGLRLFLWVTLPQILSNFALQVLCFWIQEFLVSFAVKGYSESFGAIFALTTAVASVFGRCRNKGFQGSTRAISRCAGKSISAI